MKNRTIHKKISKEIDDIHDYSKSEEISIDL